MPSILQFFKLAVKNSLGTVINPNAKILKFTGGATVTQVGVDTVVAISTSGLTGNANRVVVFNSLGNPTDDAGLTYAIPTKIFGVSTIQSQAEVLQVLGAAFIISPSKTYCPISAAAPVSSSAVTPITAGTVVGQLLIIENQSANQITLLAGGNVKLPNGANLFINQYSSSSFLWNGTNWITLTTSDNG